MGRIEDLRQTYDKVRADLEEWLPDYVHHTLQQWASGSLAAETFGQSADELDALCLMAAHEKQLDFVLWAQIQAALEQGRSWNEIAAALGVSRQAARKRFG